MLGGGPAGAATALTLARHAPALGVTVVAGAGGPGGEGWRVGETLPPAARPVLEELGVWDSFRAQGHLPSRGTSALWGPPSGRADAPLADHDFLLSPQAEGWHLDRTRFDRWLFDRAEAAGCRLLRGAAYLDHRPLPGDGPGWRLTVRGPGGEIEELRARWVVDATGRRAAFARRAGAAPVLFDDLLAVFRVFELERPREAPSSHAVVEAVEDGWWYAARLPDDRLVVGAFADPDGVANGDLRSSAGWWRRLDGTFHVRRLVAAAGLGPSSNGARPVTFPASSRHLHPMTGAGWLAVGDAASCYDPLSSQGILKALRFGRLAAYAVSDGLAEPRAGEAAAAKYARWVHRDFEGFLLARAEIYRREQRWPGATFWRRRHGGVTLDPNRLLRPGRADSPALREPTRHLPAAALHRLVALACPPRPAHQIVRRAALERAAGEVSDRRLIEALQHLVDEGALA